MFFHLRTQRNGEKVQRAVFSGAVQPVFLTEQALHAREKGGKVFISTFLTWIEFKCLTGWVRQQAKWSVYADCSEELVLKHTQCCSKREKGTPMLSKSSFHWGIASVLIQKRQFTKSVEFKHFQVKSSFLWEFFWGQIVVTDAVTGVDCLQQCLKLW